MRFRKRLGVKADSEKKLMLEIEELQEQITEFVTSSDELIKYNLQNEKEGAVLKSKIKALNELIEQSKQDVSGLLKRLNDLQTVYHDSEGMFKRLYPEATFQALALNGLYYHFFACSELRLLKPGKMFAAKGDAELSGVGESSEIFILFGAVTNNYLESALDNLWLQQIAITVISDKKNRSIERIRDGFLLQIKMANFPEVNFSILKLNRENRTIEFSFHGNPLFIFDGKKGSQITQSISSSILSATSRIGISTNGNETAARILTEIVTDPNTDIDEQLQSIKDITGVWVKIPVI